MEQPTVAHREQIGDPPWSPLTLSRQFKFPIMAIGPFPLPAVAAAPRSEPIPTTTVPTIPTTSTTIHNFPSNVSVKAAVVVQHPLIRPSSSTVPAPRVQAGYGGGLGGVWACIRMHESGGNYRANTGNGFYGAYQFALGTWRSLGGTGLPSDAAPGVQDALAQKLQARDGWGPWPQTSRMCGV